jgi:hypothetical protein
MLYLWCTRVDLSAMSGCRKPTCLLPEYKAILLICHSLWDRDTQLGVFRKRIVTAWHWVTTAEQHSHTSALEAYNTCFDLLAGHLHLATRPLIISRRKVPVVPEYCLLMQHRVLSVVAIFDMQLNSCSGVVDSNGCLPLGTVR